MVLIHAPLSTSAVLDEAADAVTLTAAPWAGLLIATTLPYRLAQVVFFDRLFEAGALAAHYGDVLTQAATWVVLAYVLAAWGRAVFARACRLAIARGGAPGRETWRVSRRALGSYLFTSVLGLLIGVVLAPTLIGYPFALMFGGLAIGTLELNERVSLAAPLRTIARHTRAVHILLALVVIFSIGFLVALANVAAAFALGLAAATAAGADAPQWALLFDFGNRTFRLLVIAGALLMLEPFWIAAHVVFVRKLGARETGDDLRAWFDELRGAA